MPFDRKAYQREYAKKRYQALSIEERRIRNSSASVKEAKIRYRANPENKQKENEYNRNWYKENKERKRESGRLARYRLSKKEYSTFIEKQNGLCPICNEFPQKKKSYASVDGFAIDHCHLTNKVRGLLCESCNKLLGNAKDSIEILENAIRYLKEASSADV